MCSCNSGDRWIVTLKSGMKITKRSEREAKSFAAKQGLDDSAITHIPAKKKK